MLLVQALLEQGDTRDLSDMIRAQGRPRTAADMANKVGALR